MIAAAKWTLARAQQEIEAGRLDSAKQLLKDILDQMRTFAPTSKELTEYYTQILSLYHRVHALICTSGPNLPDSINQLIDEARMEVRKYFEDGKELMCEEQFEDAIDCFEKAILIINFAPYAKDLVEVFMKKLLNLKQECEMRIKAKSWKSAYVDKVNKIEPLWCDALFYMTVQRFESAEILCSEILEIDPTFNDCRKMLKDIDNYIFGSVDEVEYAKKLKMYRRLWHEYAEHLNQQKNN